MDAQNADFHWGSAFLVWRLALRVPRRSVKWLWSDAAPALLHREDRQPRQVGNTGMNRASIAGHANHSLRSIHASRRDAEILPTDSGRSLH